MKTVKSSSGLRRQLDQRNANSAATTPSSSSAGQHLLAPTTVAAAVDADDNTDMTSQNLVSQSLPIPRNLSNSSLKDELSGHTTSGLMVPHTYASRRQLVYPNAPRLRPRRPLGDPQNMPKFDLPPSPQEFTQMELLAREQKEAHARGQERCMSDDYSIMIAKSAPSHFSGFSSMSRSLRIHARRPLNSPLSPLHEEEQSLSSSPMATSSQRRNGGGGGGHAPASLEPLSSLSLSPLPPAAAAVPMPMSTSSASVAAGPMAIPGSQRTGGHSLRSREDLDVADAMGNLDISDNGGGDAKVSSSLTVLSMLRRASIQERSAQQASSTAHSYAPSYRTQQQQQQSQQRRDAPYSFSHDRQDASAAGAGGDADPEEDAEEMFEMDI